jgi:hypothetical protein
VDPFRNDEPGLNAGWARSFKSKMEHYFPARLSRSVCGSAAKHNISSFEPTAPAQGGCANCIRLTTKETR